jgi:hypothetical protein
MLDSLPPAPSPVVMPAGSIAFYNKSRTMQSVQLDSSDAQGRRESIILASGEERNLTTAQFQSAEVQKLLKLGILARR